MLFTHPDELLQLVKEHQAELRHQAYAAQLTPGLFCWLKDSARRVGEWAAAAMKPHSAPEDAIWPTLKDYPYSSTEAAPRNRI